MTPTMPTDVVEMPRSPLATVESGGSLTTVEPGRKSIRQETEYLNEVRLVNDALHKTPPVDNTIDAGDVFIAICKHAAKTGKFGYFMRWSHINAALRRARPDAVIVDQKDHFELAASLLPYKNGDSEFYESHHRSVDALREQVWDVSSKAKFGLLWHQYCELAFGLVAHTLVIQARDAAIEQRNHALVAADNYRNLLPTPKSK